VPVQAGADAGAGACPPKEKLDQIEKKDREIIAASRAKGHNVAANNLQHFLDGSGTDVVVSGRVDPGTDATVDCGLAGTVLRFVPPLAALSDAAVTFDGDEQARGRPIAPLLDALRSLSVVVDGAALPFVVRGRV